MVHDLCAMGLAPSADASTNPRIVHDILASPTFHTNIIKPSLQFRLYTFDILFSMTAADKISKSLHRDYRNCLHPSSTSVSLEMAPTLPTLRLLCEP